MTLPSPNLDDRDFAALMRDALLWMKRASPAWNDQSPHDPGIVLLELFAHLTETLIYRFNRVPEKVYVELLRLLGVQLRPPAAAVVRLRFARPRADGARLVIPRDTRVTVSRAGGDGPAPVFRTDEAVEIPPGETAVEVTAHDCQFAEGELAGTTTGLPGLSLTARWKPLSAPLGDGRDLIVGIEAEGGELEEQASAVRFGDKTYAVWREVESFGAQTADAPIYVVDRAHGRITFAPSVRLADEDGLQDAPTELGAVPPPGREVRLWYRHGGGSAGNLPAGALTALADPLPGVQVTNPAPATGGRDAETLANALLRGPREFRSLQRAVTAEDYELIACQASGGIARARAFTLARAPGAGGAAAGLWMHAPPGAVEVVLVPAVPPELVQNGVVADALLRDRQSDVERDRIRSTLEARRPLGTSVRVSWARYKAVQVRARIVTHREENPERVRQRVLERLHRTINPLATDARHHGWTFGRPLRASTVYDIALSEPGVNYVDQVELVVDETPGENVRAAAADPHQPRCWYAASGDAVFRSLDDGNGWEPIGRFAGEVIHTIEPFAGRPGLLAVVGAHDATAGSRVHLSDDCGETWLEIGAETDFRIHDAAWLLRGELPVLLLATDRGLFELELRPGAVPIQLLLDAADQNLGCDRVTVAVLPGVGAVVAVAAQQTRGVLLSHDGGRSGSFRAIGLAGESVSTLAVQIDDPRAFLWAGLAAKGGDEGAGCRVIELRRSADAPGDWERRLLGWRGGTCRALACGGGTVWAATHRAGVLRVAAGRADAAWEATAVDCGLPLRDVGRLHPVDALAAGGEGRRVLAGGPVGLFLSHDGGTAWAACPQRVQGDRVAIPPNWLLCSREHALTVVGEDEVERS